MDRKVLLTLTIVMGIAFFTKLTLAAKEKVVKKRPVVVTDRRMLKLKFHQKA